MYKISSTHRSFFGGLLGGMTVLALTLSVYTVFAAPTQAPPGGNPAYPLQGPAGPQGATGQPGANGSTGPQGPAGPMYGCVMRSSCPSGWTDRGRIGVIVEYADGWSSCPYYGLQGGSYNGGWGWCHPRLCCQN